MGYIILIVSVGALCLGCYFLRRYLKIGTYTKEEESKMKSNLDLLLQSEEINPNEGNKEDEPK